MAMSRAMRKSATARILLQNVLGHDGSFALRGCGFKTWSAVNVERSWPNPDANAAAPGGNAGPAVPEGSTSSREVDPSNPNSNQNAAGSYGQTSSWSSSSKPGTGKTWPNPNAPRDTPTYTPSSYSSSSKGGGKLWDNPNGLPYWDSKWDDPTKPELRAKGWTWDPNPANSHMGTWPADQPPPNRSPLGFSPRGGASWDRGPRQNFNQNAAPGGGGNFQGGGQGGQGGFPGGNQGGQGGGFPGGNQGGGGFPGGNQGGQGGFPGGNQGGQGGFPGGNQGGQGGFPGGGQGGFPGGR